jgi:hypothetical protein
MVLLVTILSLVERVAIALSTILMLFSQPARSVRIVLTMPFPYENKKKLILTTKQN